MPADAKKCSVCGYTEPTSSASVEDRHTGKLVSGRYRIIRRVAAGGMGEVYLALHEELKYRVAVKILSKAVIEDETMVARFINEARSTCRISHPYAVVVHDFDRLDDGTPYILMEYVQGVALSAFMKGKGFLHPSMVVRLGAQLCEVLAAAHRQKIIHRDIKPDNVMVVEGAPGRYSIKMLDFGIAKILDDEVGQDLTQTGMTFGTPEYMSPEQASGELVDARSDIYSLGCLFFAMLTGRPPFENRNKLALLNHHVSTPAPSVAATATQPISKELDQLVAKMLSKRPIDRPASMEEVLDVLEGMGPQGSGVSPSPALFANHAQTAPTAPVKISDKMLGVERSDSAAFELGDGPAAGDSDGDAGWALGDDDEAFNLSPGPSDDDSFDDGLRFDDSRPGADSDEMFFDMGSDKTELLHARRPRAQRRSGGLHPLIVVVATVAIVGGVLWGATSWWLNKQGLDEESPVEEAAESEISAGDEASAALDSAADDTAAAAGESVQPQPAAADPERERRLRELGVQLREGHAMLNEARFEALESRIAALREADVAEIASDIDELQARWDELSGEEEAIRAYLAADECLPADEAVVRLREKWGSPIAARFYGQLSACREAQRCRAQGGCSDGDDAPAQQRPQEPAPRQQAQEPPAQPAAPPAQENTRRLPPSDLFAE